MSALWQMLAYVFRTVTIRHVIWIGTYTAYFILMLLAPLLTNAYVYMVVGRMAYNFTNNAKIFGVKAWRMALAFIICDIVAFIIQAAGASMASGEDVPMHQVKTGLHVYMGGIGLQELVILMFFTLSLKFRQQMLRDLPANARKGPMTLIHVVFAVLALISIRIIFRLIEYANGIESSIVRHEAYQYIFDSTVMLIALVLFNVVHPGRIMPGTESDFPSRKQRKAAGKDAKWGRASQQEDSALPGNQASYNLGQTYGGPKQAEV